MSFSERWKKREEKDVKKTIIKLVLMSATAGALASAAVTITIMSFL